MDFHIMGKFIRDQEAFRFSLIGLLTIPLFLINVWLFGKGLHTSYSLQMVLRSSSVIWIVLFSALAVYSCYLLLRAQKAGFWILLCLLLAVSVADINSIVRTKNYALAFYLLFLLVLSSGFLSNLIQVLKRAYYSSGQRWFEGSPQPLPGLAAFVRSGERYRPVQLSKLDEYGVYVFGAGQSTDLDGIRLKLDKKELESDIEIVSRQNRISGFGLKFKVRSEDQSKDLREFVETVRSRGYVE